MLYSGFVDIRAWRMHSSSARRARNAAGSNGVAGPTSHQSRRLMSTICPLVIYRAAFGYWPEATEALQKMNHDQVTERY